MLKKIIVISIMVVIVGGAISLVLFSKQKADIKNGVLSERSKAYLQEQKGKGDSQWNYTKLYSTDKAGSFVGQRVTVGNCFSFVMVFRVTNPREDGECNMYFGIEKPRGFITAYMPEGGSIGSVDQIDGVSMRRTFTDRYSEEKKEVNGVIYLVFRSKGGEYEANVFGLKNGKALVFNLMTSSPDNYDKELEAMLNSIEFGD